MPKYVLELENRSKRFGSFCVYQTCPGSKHTDDIFPLAWLSIPSHPKTHHLIDWEVDYSFEWSQAGVLKPGVRFISSQSEKADLYSADKNTIGFSKQNGAYLFTPPAGVTPSSGSLKIKCDESINHDDVSAVGIGVDGKPAFAVNASPNITFTLTPKVRYWITFGDYEQGEVISVNSITESFEIVFPKTEPYKKIILEENNKFRE